MRQPHRLPSALLCLACVSFLVGMPAPAPAATPAEVEAAIQKAKTYLLKRQKNGNWEASPKPTAPEKHSTSGGQWGGLTAISTYALLAAGESHQRPEVAKAIEFLETADIQGIYALGMRAQIWHLLPDDRRSRAGSYNDFKLLLKSLQSGKDNRGLYDYLLDPSTRVDHSVSQYGVLGMWAVAQMNVEVPNSYWAIVEKAWMDDQSKDGAWCYGKAPDDKHPYNMSMTTAGVATLFICQDYLHAQEGIQCKGNITNESLEKGLKWVSSRFDAEAKKGLNHYTWYGIERIGVAAGYKYFGTTDWYERGAETLVRSQAADGGWGNIQNTCFSILFLSRGRAPVAFAKLSYDVEGENKKTVEGHWNQRPRDVANAVKYIGKFLERDLNWQIVNLKVPAHELLDAPVLYISGDQALNFTDEEETKLRHFVQAGGLIVGTADCGKAIFAEAFKKLGSRLFPRYEFRPLPEDHVIYTNQQFLRSKWVAPPNVWGMTNGSRELMLLVPAEDMGKHWQNWGRTELLQLASNIFLYAVDKSNLRFKGETHYVARRSSATTTAKISLARIRYQGNDDPEPGGWRRMDAIMANQFGVDLEVKGVNLAKDSLEGVDVAHMTGTTKFALTPAETAKLKQFVDGGGTLVIDACGGAGPFKESAEQMLAGLGQPGQSAAGSPLDPSHAVFSVVGGTLKDIGYRPYARRVIGNTRGPRLRGGDVGGKTRIFYSAEDLSTGLVGHPVDGIIGYDPDTATELMRNVLLYAHTGGKSFKPAAKPAAAPAKPPAKK